MINKSQGNRKPYLLILIILVIFSVIFWVIIIKKNSNKWSSDWVWNWVMGNKINTTDKPKEEIVIKSFLWKYEVLQKHSIKEVEAEMQKEKTLLNNQLIIDNITKYKNQITAGCKEVIKWKKPTIIYDSVFYYPYINALKITEKNEFNIFSSLANWECEKFEKNEKDLCVYYKNKDLVKLETINKPETSYDYYFFKSIIEEKNQCNLIKEKWESDDCSNSYLAFMEIKNSKVENGDNILTNDKTTNWKILNSIWKEKYIEKLNSQFLDSCEQIIPSN